jgi:ADP-ribose pyrophosphatase
MNFYEKTIHSKPILNGHVIQVRVDTVVLPNGHQSTRELIHHPGGVAILPVDGDGYAYLVKQFRKPYDAEILEAPAGKLNPGEDHLTCGIRELTEETGFEAKQVTYLGFIYPSPGYTDEVIHLYLAQQLSMREQNLDEDEFLNVEKYRVDELVAMCLENQISDAKTVALVLRAKEKLQLS